MAGHEAGNDALLRSFAPQSQGTQPESQNDLQLPEGGQIVSDHAQNRDLLVLNRSDTA